jgi:hypothetical protein
MAPATRTPPPAGADAGEDDGGRTGGDHSRSPAAVPDLADDLADMLRRGRVWGGEPLERIVFVTVSGRRNSISLPTTAPDGPEEDDPLTEMELAVLEVVDGMRVGAVVSTDEIARRSGFSNNGSMRDFLKSLAKAGRMKRVRHGYERVS